ncbi:HAD family hydrolase [Pontivivens insulae]|uniref:Alpha-D-glucose 1-phosphate phosphatase YihX n=1 Tax=Pontivivens insulae TaxID=1639689 RepID=A0A2R8A7Z0_9RHOB|nr:HAD family phosphatase [Pontivivens insulae]RED18445.1 2-haloacid dehalogenase [Pontivivens insulae]SPF28343.1 Alpha-D-glucose 1-phosphate phosphatase YihX [Pontivivens insulae]
MPDHIRPKAVIFDIGNVLIHWKPERFYEARLGKPRSDRFFADVKPHAVNDEVDRGRPLDQMVEAHARKHPEWEDEILWWRDHWLELASPEIPESVTLLRQLKANGVPVMALSNFGIDTFEMARPRYPFLDEFDQRFISGHMGVIKPDPKIYQMLEEGTGLSGTDLLFTDDREDNIAAAAERGWQTHLFTKPEGFKAVLIERDLL